MRMGAGMAATGTNDDKLIKMVREAGHFHGPTILAESEREGLTLALALALVEQKTVCKNLSGLRPGPQSPAPWCHQRVTRDRVKALIAHVEGGGTSNGVGVTQLTSIGFIQQAEAEGGAHTVHAQCRVGFRVLRDLIHRQGA